MEIESKSIWDTEAVVFDESKQLYLEENCPVSDLHFYLAEESENTPWIRRGKVSIGCNLSLGKRQVSLPAGVEVLLYELCPCSRHLKCFDPSWKRPCQLHCLIQNYCLFFLLSDHLASIFDLELDLHLMTPCSLVPWFQAPSIITVEVRVTDLWYICKCGNYKF